MAKATEDQEARYRVRELSYIDNRLVDAGEEVVYDGLPGSNLEPLNDAAEAAAAAKAEKQRRAPAVRTSPARRAASGIVSGDDADDLA